MSSLVKWYLEYQNVSEPPTTEHIYLFYIQSTSNPMFLIRLVNCCNLRSLLKGMLHL